MFDKKIQVFTRREDPPVTSIKQLEGKIVGAVRGYSYGKEIVENPNIEIAYVDDDLTNVRKLVSHRIDAIVGDLSSTVSAINSLKKVAIFFIMLILLL